MNETDTTPEEKPVAHDPGPPVLILYRNYSDSDGVQSNAIIPLDRDADLEKVWSDIEPVLQETGIDGSLWTCRPLGPNGKRLRTSFGRFHRYGESEAAEWGQYQREM